MIEWLNRSKRMSIPLKEISVLITDDSFHNRSAMLASVRSLLGEVQLDEAPNGEMAIDLVKEKIQTTGKSYDLIIMDYEMPGINGQQTTLKIREMEIDLDDGKKSFIITWSMAKIEPFKQANAILKKPLVLAELEHILTKGFRYV